MVYARTVYDVPAAQQGTFSTIHFWVLSVWFIARLVGQGVDWIYN